MAVVVSRTCHARCHAPHRPAFARAPRRRTAAGRDRIRRHAPDGARHAPARGRPRRGDLPRAGRERAGDRSAAPALRGVGLCDAGLGTGPQPRSRPRRRARVDGPAGRGRRASHQGAPRPGHAARLEPRWHLCARDREADARTRPAGHHDRLAVRRDARCHACRLALPPADAARASRRRGRRPRAANRAAGADDVDLQPDRRRRRVAGLSRRARPVRGKHRGREQSPRARLAPARARDRCRPAAPAGRALAADARAPRDAAQRAPRAAPRACDGGARASGRWPPPDAAVRPAAACSERWFSVARRRARWFRGSPGTPCAGRARGRVRCRASRGGTASLRACAAGGSA